MKKILLSILGIFFGLSTFCSADIYTFDNNVGSQYYAGCTFINSVNPGYIIFGFKVNDKNFIIYTGIAQSTNYNYYVVNDLSDNFIFSGSFSYDSNIAIFNDFQPIDTFVYTGIKLYIYAPSNTPVRFYSYTFPLESTYFNIIGLHQRSCSNNKFRGFDSFTYEFVDSSLKFIVNYGNQSKEYTITDDVDIYINSPVSKNGSIFTFDGSTGINLVYNGQYNWYIKNKLYLDGQFRYRQGVFTPICLK